MPRDAGIRDASPRSFSSFPPCGRSLVFRGLMCFLAFLVLFGMSVGSGGSRAHAAPLVAPVVSSTQAEANTPVAGPATIAPDGDLDGIESALRSIYRTRIDPHDGQSATTVATLTRQAAAIENRAKTIVSRLEPYEQIYKSMLDVLGPAPAKDAPPEPASLTDQRTKLLAAQRDLGNRLTRARLYVVQAHQMGLILSQRTDAVQQAVLLQRFHSPLVPAFWAQLAGELSDDLNHGRMFTVEGVQTIASAFQGEGFVMLTGCTLGAIILYAIPFFLLIPTRRAAARMLPDGRARRVTAAIFYSACCAAFAAFGSMVLWLGLTGARDVDGSSLARLADTVGAQIPLAAFVMGASLAILAPRKPDWRVAPFSDAAANALMPYALWFALLLLFRGVLRFIDTESGFGQIGVQASDAMFILAAAPLLVMAPKQVIRHPLMTSDDTPIRQGTIGRMVRVLALLVSVFCVVALLLGYVPLGYTTLSWICSMVVTFMGLTLIFLLANDLATSVFTSSGAMGRHFVALGLSARIVDQGTTIIGGLFSVFLVFVAVAVAQSGGDFDFAVIIDNIGKMILGNNIGGVSISFDAILKCIAVPIIGHYVITLVQGWLKNRLFPTTMLDLGAQTSILTIFTYAAWILVGLMVMSALGVTVKSMTWVVSALSVGIGFGLQSIVQNFVSGIILLAERPVTIGDLVEIGGKVGDIRRISVRSTDLALSDGSTMIVPNSQFITSAVRNVTLGHPTGTVSVTMSVPRDTDLAKVIGLMSGAMKDVPGLLDTPAPSVSIASIEFDRMTLSVGGKTTSPRQVDAVANAVRLAIWNALHENGIVASLEPQA